MGLASQVLYYFWEERRDQLKSLHEMRMRMISDPSGHNDYTIYTFLPFPSDMTRVLDDFNPFQIRQFVEGISIFRILLECRFEGVLDRQTKTMAVIQMSSSHPVEDSRHNQQRNTSLRPPSTAKKACFRTGEGRNNAGLRLYIWGFSRNAGVIDTSKTDQ